MSPHFLFPASPLTANEVDEPFAAQFAAVRAAGFTASLCPDAVLAEGRPLRRVPAGATVVYRGWMLTGAEYSRLAEAIVAASASPLTTPDEYLATHHLPNWAPRIAEHTPETRVLPPDADWEAELGSLGWDAFFVKDYVKSLKTGRGSIARRPAEIAEIVAELKKYRDEIEGGICVRRVEAFVPETERRWFVLRGVPHSADGRPAPAIVESAAARIASPFFSVDVVERVDGVLRVVEIGDGQVSDLVGWSADAFVAMWKPHASHA